MGTGVKKALPSTTTRGALSLATGDLHLPIEAAGMDLLGIVPHELAHRVQMEILKALGVYGTQLTLDAAIALYAALEGNAQAVASAILGAMMGQTEDTDVRDAFRSMAREALTTGRTVRNTFGPRWDSAEADLAAFPYEAGVELVQAVATKEDPVAMGVIHRPPGSTAEVMDPERYREGWKPVTATPFRLAERIPGARAVHDDVIGRFELNQFGRRHTEGALTLGDGWQGDRMECAEHPGGLATVWTVLFSEPEQAERFGQAYRDWASTNGREATTIEVRGSQTIILQGIPPAQQDEIAQAARAAFP